MSSLGIFSKGSSILRRRGLGAVVKQEFDEFGFSACLANCEVHYGNLLDPEEIKNKTICQSDCSTAALQKGVTAGGGGPATGYPWKVYSANTALFQRTLNNWLLSQGARGIGTDGKLGPETCGAAKWGVENGFVGGSVPKSCQGFSYDPGLAPKPPPVVGPPPVVAEPPITPLPPSKPKMSTANMLVGGGILAAVGVVGYAIAKKKGWIAG